MQQKKILSVFAISLVWIFSCKKENETTNDCFPGASTIRQIANKQATIKATGTQFYIVEQGTIDTKLAPCNLPQAFQVDNLRVTISGDVKLTMHNGAEPCCTENFFITNITR